MPVLFLASAIATCLIVAATNASTASAYPQLPDRVPLHIGIGGKVDQWGPRACIWIIPGTQIVSLCIIIAAFVAIQLQLPNTHGSAAGLAVFAPCQLAILWRVQVMLIDAARKSSERIDMHVFWLWFVVLMAAAMAAVFLLH